jgi:hypothetical protein
MQITLMTILIAYILAPQDHQILKKITLQNYSKMTFIINEHMQWTCMQFNMLQDKC